MKCEQNVDLSKYTTIRIGGFAKNMLIPEDIAELKMIINKYHPRYFIGGGSNLLISNQNYELVVNLREFDKSVIFNNDGTVTVGASVRLQKLINSINEYGFGGIEYLFSVPGLVGGAIVMNAGRGVDYCQSIADYIVSVEAFDENGDLITLRKEDCCFSYRNSVFKNGRYVVCRAVFRFPSVSIEESTELKRKRLELCKKEQDSLKPNFGTVFLKSNRYIMSIVKIFHMGKKVHFSKKTSNWIINEGGNFEDAIFVMRKVEKIHKVLGRKCEREVIVWENEVTNYE